MLLTANPRGRDKSCAQDVVGGFRRQLFFEERGLEEVQAHGSLECDSAGAEPIIVIMFVGKYVQQACGTQMGWARLYEARVTAGWVAQGMA